MKLCALGEGVPFERGMKQRYLPTVYITAIGSFSVKKLQIGTEIGLLWQALVTSFLGIWTSMTLNNLEPSK